MTRTSDPAWEHPRPRGERLARWMQLGPLTCVILVLTACGTSHHQDAVAELDRGVRMAASHHSPLGRFLGRLDRDYERVEAAYDDGERRTYSEQEVLDLVHRIREDARRSVAKSDAYVDEAMTAMVTAKAQLETR